MIIGLWFQVRSCVLTFDVINNFWSIHSDHNLNISSGYVFFGLFDNSKNYIIELVFINCFCYI